MKNIIVLLVIFLWVTNVDAQSFKVIVNSENSISSLSAKEATDIFMKKQSAFSNGVTAIPVDLPKNSEIRKDFSETVLGKPVATIKSYWQQYVFSGQGTPPLEKSTDDEVINFVKTNSGAIGYVSASSNVSGVKLIEIN